MGHLPLRRRERAGDDGVRAAEDAPAHAEPHGHGGNRRVSADPAGAGLWLHGRRGRRDHGEVHGGAAPAQVGRDAAHSGQRAAAEAVRRLHDALRRRLHRPPARRIHRRGESGPRRRRRSHGLAGAVQRSIYYNLKKSIMVLLYL